MTQKINNTESVKWYHTSFSKAVGVFGSICVLFTAGYQVGVTVQETRNNIIINDLKLKHIKEIEDEREKYRNTFLDIYGKKINNLEIVIADIKGKNK